MQKSRTATRQLLNRSVLMPIVRAHTSQHAELVLDALTAAEGGFSVSAISSNTPHALQIIRRRQKTYPNLCLGVSNVTNLKEVEAAKEAEARFIISLHTSPTIISAGLAADLVVVAGAFTPTEVQSAHQAGADFIVLFPPSALGDVGLRALRNQWPEIPLGVAGDISLDDISTYVTQGASLICLGSTLTTGFDPSPAQTITNVKKSASESLKAFNIAQKANTCEISNARGYVLNLDLQFIRSRPLSERVSLSSFISHRDGEALKLGPLIELLDLLDYTLVELVSHDGQKRILKTRVLYETGLLHYASNGQPLLPSEGGPFRLYLFDGEDKCDNLKGLVSIKPVNEESVPSS